MSWIVVTACAIFLIIGLIFIIKDMDKHFKAIGWIFTILSVAIASVVYIPYLLGSPNSNGCVHPTPEPTLTTTQMPTLSSTTETTQEHDGNLAYDNVDTILGTIDAITGTTEITVQTPRARVAFPISNSALVWVDYRRQNIYGLQLGMDVEVRLNLNREVSSITATSTENMTPILAFSQTNSNAYDNIDTILGIIDAITGTTEITVQTPRARVAFPISNSASVWVDYIRQNIYGLQLGMDVEVRLNRNREVSSITATSAAR